MEFLNGWKSLSEKPENGTFIDLSYYYNNDIEKADSSVFYYIDDFPKLKDVVLEAWRPTLETNQQFLEQRKTHALYQQAKEENEIYKTVDVYRSAADYLLEINRHKNHIEYLNSQVEYWKQAFSNGNDVYLDDVTDLRNQLSTANEIIKLYKQICDVTDVRNDDMALVVKKLNKIKELETGKLTSEQPL